LAVAECTEKYIHQKYVAQFISKLVSMLYTCHTAKDTTNKNTVGEGWSIRIKDHHLILTKRNIKHVNNWKKP